MAVVGLIVVAGIADSDHFNLHQAEKICFSCQNGLSAHIGIILEIIVRFFSDQEASQEIRNP